MSFNFSDAHKSPHVQQDVPTPSTSQQPDLLDEEILFVLTLQEILAGRITCTEEIELGEENSRKIAENLLFEKLRGGVPFFWRRYDTLTSMHPFLREWKSPVAGLEQLPSSGTVRGDNPQGDVPGLLLSALAPQTVRWLWKPYIPLSKLTLLDGDPGTGKSLLLCDIAARLTRGWPMPDGTPGARGAL